ncbi:MAG: translation elongation factor Ts [Candidatus Omnitrophica bacterium]|nr:translation elongation factor Ts [Candidatus Omnitrophota bacterium]
MSELDAVKTLRFKTSAGMMECKEALKESGGDMDKAVEILRKKGVAKAAKKASRIAGEGMVECYIHTGNKIGVLVEVNCETDFVARNEDFKKAVKEIAMQVAAVSPTYVSREDVPEEVKEKEKSLYSDQVKGKPANIVEKILEGKLDKFYSDVCLLEQAYIKNPDIKVKDFVTELVGKIGENIVIKRFTRFEVGEQK